MLLRKINNTEQKFFYRYRIGSIEQLQKGNLSRTIIPERDFRSVFSKLENNLRLSNVLGVYQTHEPVNETSQYMEELLDVKILKDRTIQNALLSRYDILDDIDPDLVHISFNPAKSDKEFIETLLYDPFNRIKISAYRELPNFYEKRSGGVFKLIEKQFELQFGRSIYALTPNEIKEQFSSEVRFDSFLSLKPEAINLYEHLKKFGLTREEYFLMSDFEL